MVVSLEKTKHSQTLFRQFHQNSFPHDSTECFFCLVYFIKTPTHYQGLYFEVNMRLGMSVINELVEILL